MEKFFALFKLGAKYLYRYRRRYSFLLAALVFGFAVVTFITSVKDGMYENVYYAAQSHYAGDIVAIAISGSGATSHLEPKEISAILEAARVSRIDPQAVVLRTLAFDKAIVFFNGVAVELKYTVGSDWESEAHLFGKMSFDAPPDGPLGEDGIILSAPIAARLGAVKGDSVVMEINNIHGQKNTGSFIVRGIARDASIFGYYKAYVSRVVLNRLYGFGDGDSSTVGFFFEDQRAIESKRARFHKALSPLLETGPLVHSREELDKAREESWEGYKIFLHSLPVYLSEIADLLDALNAVTYFLYGMMLLIILVSATVTYRLILHERVKEMGTMRAIGFYGKDLRLVLWTEVAALGVVSLAAGFLLAWILSWALSFLSFSWFPSFEIFLKNGRLAALYRPATALINAAAVFLLLFVTAVFPSFRASRKNLPGLLSGEPL